MAFWNQSKWAEFKNQGSCQNPKFSQTQTYKPKPSVFAGGRGERIIAVISAKS
jgi:hypothetical protein